MNLSGISWSLDVQTMGLAVLAAGDSAAFLSGVNPSLFTIRTFRGDWASKEGTAADIRRGMAIGNSLALMVGAGATAVSKSWWPLVLTALVAGALSLAYEWAIRCPRRDKYDGQLSSAIETPW